jgi:hypothetical protein
MPRDYRHHEYDDDDEVKMEFLPHEKSDDVRNNKGVLVDFPEDGFRMPPQRLPHEIGRVDESHPFRKSVVVILISLIIFLAGFIFLAGATCMSSEKEGDSVKAVTEMFREPGSITYQKEILHGWFLDEKRQHFLAEDGRRFTYVDSHSREGSPVSGYWRLIE